MLSGARISGVESSATGILPCACRLIGLVSVPRHYVDGDIGLIDKNHKISGRNVEDVRIIRAPGRQRKTEFGLVHRVGRNDDGHLNSCILVKQ